MVNRDPIQLTSGTIGSASDEHSSRNQARNANADET
jgi:hypothetical protein